MGVFIYLGWFVVVFASIVVAIVHLARNGFRGAAPALAAITGALLTWAFVSACIGVIEVDGYEGTMAFLITLAVGVAGVALLALSCLGFRRPAIKTDASRSTARE